MYPSLGTPALAKLKVVGAMCPTTSNGMNRPISAPHGHNIS